LREADQSGAPSRKVTMTTALKLDLEAALQALKEHGEDNDHADYGDWEGRFHEEFAKLVDIDGRLIEKNLQQFRGRCIYVSDQPNLMVRRYGSDHAIWRLFIHLLYLVQGGRRTGVKETFVTFRVLENKGYLNLLAKYPNSDVGKPFNIRYRGYRFTNRYLRHIYILGMFNEHVAPILSAEPIVLDIGCSYGLFSSLVKKEHPGSRHVLVDLPGQLLLAHYYLGTLFPDARIAGFKDVCGVEKVDRSFIEKYDFVLLPTTMYGKLTRGAVDLVANFVSFAEMPREWVTRYFDSAPVRSAAVLFTINRYDSYPTYTNSITVLDYPFSRYETIYMRTCPILRVRFEGRAFFGTRKIRYPSELFQFVGRLRDLREGVHSDRLPSAD
jgi:putative sugar O-methyltransferase